MDEKVAENMRKSVFTSEAEHASELAKMSSVHAAELADVAERLENKCKEVEHVEEKLHDLDKIEDEVGYRGIPGLFILQVYELFLISN